MRIAVFTDAHANLTALEAALDEIERQNCDLIVHTGDAIAIGPNPCETLDLLLDTPRVECLVGNHEALFLHGLPDPLPEWISAGEAAHQRWTHEQLGAVRREQLRTWAMTLDRRFAEVDVHFAHYGIDDETGRFVPFPELVSGGAMDRVFAGVGAELVFFGHQHEAAAARGRAHYVNPGALGCHRRAEARFCVVEFDGREACVTRHAVPYDDRPLIRAFIEQEVPERSFIDRTFFGGRLGLDGQ